MAQADSQNTTITSAIDRRGALGALAAVAAAGALSIAPALAVQTAADPIIAAIEAHRAAEAAFGHAVTAADVPETTPEYAQRQLVCAETGEASYQAAFALFEAEPATMAGLIALLNYAVLYVNSGNIWPSPHDYEWDGDGLPGVRNFCAGFETALLARTVDLLRNKFAEV